MLELKDGFVLYHGSYCEVKEPDLAKCAKRKDFEHLIRHQFTGTSPIMTELQKS